MLVFSKKKEWENDYLDTHSETLSNSNYGCGRLLF